MAQIKDIKIIFQISELPPSMTRGELKAVLPSHMTFGFWRSSCLGMTLYIDPDIYSTKSLEQWKRKITDTIQQAVLKHRVTS